MSDTTILTGTLPAGFDGPRSAATELLVTIYDDGTAEAATRPAGSDPWRMWSPPVRLEREPLPAAATRTRKPGLCRCGQPGCSDGAVRR